MKRISHWKVIALLLIVYDLLAVNISYFAALLLRFDLSYSHIPLRYLNTWKNMVLPYSAFCLLVIHFLKLYNSLWRFASYNELLRIIVASVVTTLFQVIVSISFFEQMPVSYYVFGAIFQLGLILAIRFSYRFVLLLRTSRKTDKDKSKHVMLIGGGNAGQMILRDINNAREVSDKVVCIIDDNKNKW